MIKGKLDGLQVLKGGQGKATIYFTKEVMHGALDLNESEVMLGKFVEDKAEVLPVELSIVSNVREILVRAIDEIDRNSGTNASAGTEKLAEMPMSSQQANIGHDPDATGDLSSAATEKDSGPGVPLPMGVVEGEKHEAD